MPNEHDPNVRDSSILPPSNRIITTEMEEAHEEALKLEVSIPALFQELKVLVPSKVEALETKLRKYHAGTIRAQAAYVCAKMDVGNDAMFTALEKLAPGYDRVHVQPSIGECNGVEPSHAPAMVPNESLSLMSKHSRTLPVPHPIIV